MDRIERNKLLVNIAYAILDLVEENQMLAKECKHLSDYREMNENTNRQILKHQQESIGSLLKHLIHEGKEEVA